MAVRFSVVLQDSSGNAQTGKNVDLYIAGGAKYGDFTDNGDGAYYIAVDTTRKYDVYVDGVLQDELTSIYIVADDVIVDISAKADKVSSPTSGNFAGLDASGNLTDSGNSASDFFSGSIINDLTTGGTTDALSAEQGKTLKTQLGDIDFSTALIVQSGDDVTEAIERLDAQVYQNLSNSTGGVISKRVYFQFEYDGNTASGTTVYQNMASGIACSATHGYQMIRGGHITGISATWTGGSVTPPNGSSFKINSLINGSTKLQLMVSDTDVTNKKEFTTTELGNHSFSSGDVLGCSVTKVTGDYLTDLVVLVEVTISE